MTNHWFTNNGFKQNNMIIRTTEKNIYKDNKCLGEMKVYRTLKFGQNLENNQIYY